MKHPHHTLIVLATFALAITLGAVPSVAASKRATPPPWGTHLLITNDDVSSANTATFYTIFEKGGLKQKIVVSTGGTGLGGGYFGTGRINVVHGNTHDCVYVSDATSNDIAGIDVYQFKLAGTFKASNSDNGNTLGVGIAVSAKYLYAGFSASNTIATYRLLIGCSLKFLNDVSVSGLNGGAIEGMAANGNMLVVAYGDGSIESFDISTGKPVSNGDKQLSTGSLLGNLPAGVDISQDGHFALFGDTSSGAVIEISDISSGKLTATIPYILGVNGNSSNIHLSEDESLVYFTNNSTGQVSAAFFNPVTGGILPGCISNVLLNFGSTWFYTAGLTTELNTGTGSVLYVAEWGQPSSIGILNVSKGTAANPACTLTETSFSPAADPNSQGLLSIGAFPPRSF